jgi:hypothetical protein
MTKSISTLSNQLIKLFKVLDKLDQLNLPTDDLQDFICQTKDQFVNAHTNKLTPEQIAYIYSI